MNPFMHACIHLCMHSSVYACIHPFMHALPIQDPIQPPIHPYMHVCIHLCMHHLLKTPSHPPRCTTPLPRNVMVDPALFTTSATWSLVVKSQSRVSPEISSLCPTPFPKLVYVAGKTRFSCAGKPRFFCDIINSAACDIHNKSNNNKNIIRINYKNISTLHRRAGASTTLIPLRQ